MTEQNNDGKTKVRMRSYRAPTFEEVKLWFNGTSDLNIHVSPFTGMPDVVVEEKEIYVNITDEINQND